MNCLMRQKIHIIDVLDALDVALDVALNVALNVALDALNVALDVLDVSIYIIIMYSPITIIMLYMSRGSCWTLGRYIIILC